MPIPLIIWGIGAGALALAGAGATAAKGYGEYQREHGLIYTTLQDWGLAPQVATPKPPPAPAAPQTREEMKTWTPAQQEAQDAANFRQWGREGAFTPPTPKPPPPGDKWPDEVVIGAAALGAISLLSILVGGKRR